MLTNTFERLETSRSAIFATGEVTGIAGGEKALIEGRLCGLSILDSLEKSAPTAAALHRRLLFLRDRKLAFGALLNRM